MGNQKHGRNLTEGSIPRHLLAVALPMLAGNLIHVSYMIVNAIWIGRFLGKEAVGAVAVSFPIMFILIAVASGATMATTILISQYYGAGNRAMVQKTVGNSAALSLALSTLIIGIGMTFSHAMLGLMGTPPDVLALADPYLRISFAGFIFMFLSFLISSILRGLGDTVTPLLFMGSGAIMNAILDPLLILGVGPFPRLGLNGAAVASILSSAFGAIVGLVYLNRKDHIAAISPRTLRWDGGSIRLIFRIGFPSMIQQSLVSFGNAVITTFVNSFGAAAIAALGVAMRIESLAFMPALTLSMASSAMASQNLGAGKPERVESLFRWGVLMTSAIALSVSLLVACLPRQLISIFVRDASVMDIGTTYLRMIGPFYILFAVMFVANGVINGSGRTLVTMLFTLVSLWGIRIPAAGLLSRTSLGIRGIWIAVVLSFAITMIISLLYYFSGKWKKPLAAFRPKAVPKPVAEPRPETI